MTDFKNIHLPMINARGNLLKMILVIFFPMICNNLQKTYVPQNAMHDRFQNQNGDVLLMENHIDLKNDLTEKGIKFVIS